MRRTFAALVAGFLLIASPASAQTAAPSVTIREAALDPDGLVRLTVAVGGVASPRRLSNENFTLTEQGEGIVDFSVEPLFAEQSRPVAVALVMDVSGSTLGAPIAAAKTAATGFVRGLPAGVRVGVYSFADAARRLTPFTLDRGVVTRTINALAAAGDTALYDAIVLAAADIGKSSAQRNIVVFSDGRDRASTATIDQAIAAARRVRAPVTTVALATDDLDPASLDRIAKQTGGRSVLVQSAGLGAAFAGVAQEIASQYVITYRGTRLDPAELDLTVRLTVGEVSAVDTITVLNPRVRPATSAPPPPAKSNRLLPAFLDPFLDSRGAMALGLLAAAAALLLLGTVLVETVSQPEGARSLELATRAARRARTGGVPEVEVHGARASMEALGRKTAEFVGRLPRSARYTSGLTARLERGAVPLRTGEFIALQMLATLSSGLVVFALLRHWWMALAALALGALVPWVIVDQKARKRSQEFVAQLPDTLQMIAASLQAGHAFLAALDTIVREAKPPTSVEFGRVLAEARLGMPVEEAMMTLADRIGSEDFRWVVLAVTIQRQTGGNLAELLQTVASTLRERERVRRQIRVLSAEGRLSAVVLIFLPFAIAGYMMIVNPGYLQRLTASTTGRVALGIAGALMGLGIAWMRKIIRIEV